MEGLEFGPKFLEKGIDSGGHPSCDLGLVEILPLCCGQHSNKSSEDRIASIQIKRDKRNN